MPLPWELVRELVQDVKELYPEAVACSIVGTYARPETPSQKPHDVDLLVKFQEMPNETKTSIQMRNDLPLWEKWRKKSPVTLDVLLRFGNTEPGYGQHQYRIEQGLPTPEVEICRFEPTAS